MHLSTDKNFKADQKTSHKILILEKRKLNKINFKRKAMDTPDLSPDLSPDISPQSSHHCCCSSDSNGNTSTNRCSFKLLPEAITSKLILGQSFWETQNILSLHISCASCDAELIVWLSISLNKDRYQIGALDVNAFCQQCGSGNKGKARSLKSPKERESARKKQEKLDAFHELRRNWICCGGLQFLESSACGKHNNWLSNKCPKCTHCCCSGCKNWPGPNNVMDFLPREPGPGHVRPAQPAPAPVMAPIAPPEILAVAVAPAPAAPVNLGRQDPNEDDEEEEKEPPEERDFPGA